MQPVHLWFAFLILGALTVQSIWGPENVWLNAEQSRDRLRKRSASWKPYHFRNLQEDDTDEPTEEPTDEPTELATDPATEEPTDPVTDSPTDPATEAPTDPATEEPSDPVTEVPTEPVTEEPTEPATDEPTDSETDEPTPETTGTDDSVDSVPFDNSGSASDELSDIASLQEKEFTDKLLGNADLMDTSAQALVTSAAQITHCVQVLAFASVVYSGLLFL